MPARHSSLTSRHFNFAHAVTFQPCADSWAISPNRHWRGIGIGPFRRSSRDPFDRLSSLLRKRETEPAPDLKRAQAMRSGALIFRALGNLEDGFNLLTIDSYH
jgi:hypothetical protein